LGQFQPKLRLRESPPVKWIKHDSLVERVFAFADVNAWGVKTIMSVVEVPLGKKNHSL